MKITGPILRFNDKDAEGDAYLSPLRLRIGSEDLVVTNVQGDGPDELQFPAGRFPLVGSSRVGQDLTMGFVTALRMVGDELHADVEILPSYESAVETILSYVAVQVCPIGWVQAEGVDGITALNLRSLQLGLNRGRNLAAASIVCEVKPTTEPVLPDDTSDTQVEAN